MTHGRPDCLKTNTSNIGYNSRSWGENAARRGSPITYDRRGDVVWYDDCESAIVRWTITSAGAGSGASTVTTVYPWGDRALRLRAVFAAGSFCQADKYLPKTREGILGLEFNAFSQQTAAAPQHWLRWCDGSKTYIGGIKIQANGFVYYWDSTGNWTLLLNILGFNPFWWLWSNIKFTMDVENGYYRWLRLDNYFVDMSTLQLQNVAGVQRPHTDIRLRTDGNVAAQNLYTDNVILTQNEPRALTF